MSRHVVSVFGEADLESAPQLRRVLTPAIDGGARRLLTDLSATTFIDSTTLGVLLGAVKRLRDWRVSCALERLGAG